MLKKTKFKKTWSNFTSSVRSEGKSVLLTKQLVSQHIDKFWSEVLTKIEKTMGVDNPHHYLMMFRLKFASGSSQSFSTIGKMFQVNYSQTDQQYVKDTIFNILDIRDGGYNFTNPLDSIVILYGVREGDLADKPKYTIVAKTQPAVNIQTFNHYKLPITMDPAKYGIVLSTAANQHFVQVTDKYVAVITAAAYA